MQLYQAIAAAIVARANCDHSGNSEWFDRWTDRLLSIGKNLLPSGSGFDCGSHIDMVKSSGEKLRIETMFHHMDENGSYCGWSEHVVTVKPSLAYGFLIDVSGRDVRGIKDYIAETFHYVLSAAFDWEDLP